MIKIIINNVTFLLSKQQYDFNSLVFSYIISNLNTLIHAYINSNVI